MANKLTFEEVQGAFDVSAGKHVAIKEFINTKSPIYFECTSCGVEGKILWANFRKGKNASLLCSKCLEANRVAVFREKTLLPFATVKKEFEDRGAVLVSTEYKGAKEPLTYLCTSCGEETTITWSNLKAGQNESLVCLKCAGRVPPTRIEVAEYLESVGSVLYSEEISKTTSRIEVGCSDCKRHFSTTWYRICNYNKEVKCYYCRDTNKIILSDIAELMKSKGAELITDRYENNRTPLYFKCSKCGEQHHIIREAILAGTNSNFLCSSCLKGTCLSPDSSYGSRSPRSRMDTYWFGIVKEFFNIVELDLYSSHHVKPYSIDEEKRTDICNGFPIRKDYHANGYVDNKGNQNPFHTLQEYLDITNWSKIYALPYHNYEDFKFLDLSKYVVTEFVGLNEIPSGFLLKKKEEFASRRINYIPLFIEELFIPAKKQIVYSMLRARLWKHYKDIYQYTGVELRKVYARKTVIKEVPFVEVKEFLRNSHIQSFVPSSINIGLYHNDILIEVMTFGQLRNEESKPDCYELLRLASAINTMVIGGTEKLFKYFLKTYNPERIVSYCDIRFSTLNPEETIYHRLGFKYLGNTIPGYHYVDSKILRVFSRQVFQKHKLKDKLEIYNPNLSEKENMRANNYICQYNCGNMKFEWKREL